MNTSRHIELLRARGFQGRGGTPCVASGALGSMSSGSPSHQPAATHLRAQAVLDWLAGLHCQIHTHIRTLYRYCRAGFHRISSCGVGKGDKLVLTAVALGQKVMTRPGQAPAGSGKTWYNRR